MKAKAHTFKIENPAKAMDNFTSLLGKLMKVPKVEVEAKRARVKKQRLRKRKRKSQDQAVHR